MPSLSFLAPSRCVLVIGDEALYIYDESASSTRLVETVLWSAANFEVAVSDIIKRECRGKPVLILNDMTDQHFKGGQRMPKVGAMDRANVLTRKLNAAFPNYPIRGALPIKDKASKNGAAYLFAAVPMSEPVSKSLSAVKQSLAAIAGFVLLPIESSDMVKAFAEKAMKRDKTKSRWAILIGQHIGGGLRQVITRDGQLAMTRMTPITDLATDPEAWVNEVTQEFKATISYLSRFGYSPEDGTEVIVISTPSAGQELQARIDVPCNFNHYTVTEAAEVLGFKIGLQDNQYHADPLHAAWAGRKSRFILPMEALDIKKLGGPRQAAMVAGLLLFVGAGYLGWQLAAEGQSWMEARDSLADQKRMQTTVEAQYLTEVERMKQLGFDIKLIQSSLKTFRALEADGIHPLPLFKAVGMSLGQELRLDKMIVKRNGDPELGVPKPDPANPQPTDKVVKPSDLEAILTLSFPPTLDPEIGVKQVNELKTRLTTNLPPTYTVAVSKQVADLIYTENTGGEVGTPKDKDAKKEDFKAEITIRGPLQ
jgi:hypothetical protein